MKKVLIILTILAIIVFSYFYFTKNNNNNNGSDYSVQKTSFENKSNENSSVENTNDDNNNTTNSANTIESTPQPEPVIKEVELSSFSTPLKSKASGRLTNISITCTTLNNTIVKSGETFSFCSTIGQTTADKGYQEADVIVHGKKEKALGGGNCQVSTTLYNAVLALPTVQVTERHEHGKNVNYIEDGKDAAVAYGSMDLKFINNSEYDIKIAASSDSNNVYITLYSMQKG